MPVEAALLAASGAARPRRLPCRTALALLAGDVALGAAGHEGGDGGAGSRQHADEKAQHRRSGRWGAISDLFLAQLEAAELLHLPGLFLAAVLAGAQHRHQDLREGKGGHGQQQEGETVTQVRQAEGKPVYPTLRSMPMVGS